MAFNGENVLKVLLLSGDQQAVREYVQILVAAKDEAAKRGDEAAKRADEAAKRAELLEEQRMELLLQLARHQNVYAMRPLLEYGLRQYQQARPELAGTSMTYISYELMKSAIFCVGSDDLQEWVSKKLACLKSLCGRQISAGKRFGDYLWDIYRTLSSLHHELPDDGSTGFVISNANTYETAALVILICALQHEGCLQVFGLKWKKIDNRDCLRDSIMMHFVEFAAKHHLTAVKYGYIVGERFATSLLGFGLVDCVIHD